MHVHTHSHRHGLTQTHTRPHGTHGRRLRYPGQARTAARQGLAGTGLCPGQTSGGRRAVGCGPRCPGGEAAPAPTTASPPLAGHRGAASLSAPVCLSASAPGPACAQTAGLTRVSRACRRCVSDSRPPEPGRGVGAGDKGAQPRAPAGGSGFAGGDAVSGPGDAVTRLTREPWAPGAARAVPAGAEVLQRL